jgi:hypothetical protein
MTTHVDNPRENPHRGEFIHLLGLARRRLGLTLRGGDTSLGAALSIAAHNFAGEEYRIGIEVGEARPRISQMLLAQIAHDVCGIFGEETQGDEAAFRPWTQLSDDLCAIWKRRVVLILDNKHISPAALYERDLEIANDNDNALSVDQAIEEGVTDGYALIIAVVNALRPFACAEKGENDK